jgi:hypothetical protein
MVYLSREEIVKLLHELHQKQGGVALKSCYGYGIRGEGEGKWVFEIVSPVDVKFKCVKAIYRGEVSQAQTFFEPEGEGFSEYRLIFQETGKNMGVFTYEKGRTLTIEELTQELASLPKKWSWAKSIWWEVERTAFSLLLTIAPSFEPIPTY